MKYISVIILTLLLHSCIVIKFQGPDRTTGYSRLSDKQKDSICFVSADSIVNIEKDTFLYYAISGQQIYNLLSDSDITVLYEWTPHCSSENCIPISLVRSYCEENNYKCIIVADDYYVFNSSQFDNDKGIIYFKNHIYYNEDNGHRCSRKFETDFLSNYGLTKKAPGNRFLLLKGKDFLGAFSKIEDVDVFLHK